VEKVSKANRQVRPGDLAAIADEVGTPLYVYDAAVFRARVARLEAAIGSTPHLICYSAKANDALALLALAASEGLGLDIVSGGELFKATRAGVPAGGIVFSGVGKRRDELRAALAAGVRSVNVESPGELDLLADEAAALGTVAPVSIRLNPDVAAETHPAIATGAATSKFGLAPEGVLAGLRRAAGEPQLEPVGISFHIGSQLLDPAPVLAAARRAAALWQELAAEGIGLRDFDAGGGLGIPYDGEGEPDVEAYASTLAGVAAELGATLLLEPGRWLVGPAGTFLTRVLYVKEVPGRLIAICDGGMNDLIRPSLYGAVHPVEIVGGGRGRPTVTVDVVGPVCESGDFLARGRELPLPQPGDLLAIGSTGAYGRVMSSTYNARPLCAEVLVDGDAWRVTRKAGDYEDLIRGESV
jgi:diaminopimelate decarboxylase